MKSAPEDFRKHVLALGFYGALRVEEITYDDTRPSLTQSS